MVLRMKTPAITRVVLQVAGLISVAFGVAYLVAPVAMARITGVEIPTALGMIDVRGFYGGQLAGLGVLLLYLSANAVRAHYGLLVLAATLGGTALGRLIGFLTSFEFPLVMVVAFVAEALTAAAALWLVRAESE